LLSPSTHTISYRDDIIVCETSVFTAFVGLLGMGNLSFAKVEAETHGGLVVGLEATDVGILKH